MHWRRRTWLPVWRRCLGLPRSHFHEPAGNDSTTLNPGQSQDIQDHKRTSTESSCFLRSRLIYLHHTPSNSTLGRDHETTISYRQLEVVPVSFELTEKQRYRNMLTQQFLSLSFKLPTFHFACVACSYSSPNSQWHTAPASTPHSHTPKNTSH